MPIPLTRKHTLATQALWLESSFALDLPHRPHPPNMFFSSITEKTKPVLTCYEENLKGQTELKIRLVTVFFSLLNSPLQMFLFF